MLTLDSAVLCSKMFVFARKMLGFARNFFQKLCSRSLGDRSKFCYARNARPFIRSRSLGSKIQNPKLCSRSLGSKISMLEMLEIDVLAARSQLYCIYTIDFFQLKNPSWLDGVEVRILDCHPGDPSSNPSSAKPFC